MRDSDWPGLSLVMTNRRAFEQQRLFVSDELANAIEGLLTKCGLGLASATFNRVASSGAKSHRKSSSDKSHPSLIVAVDGTPTTPDVGSGVSSRAPGSGCAHPSEMSTGLGGARHGDTPSPANERRRSR